MTLCPASGTDRWANGWPVGQPYQTAQCWDCLQRIALVVVPARFGLPGEMAVLKAHERPAKP